MRATAVLLLASLAACAGGDRNGAEAAGDSKGAPASRASDGAPLASRDCSRAQGDSAQAVCLAENEIERMDSIQAQAYAIQRRGDTICVHTWPDRERYPNMLDGEGAVEVVGGRVIASLTGDSVPCPGDQARVLRERSAGGVR